MLLVNDSQRAVISVKCLALVSVFFFQFEACKERERLLAVDLLTSVVKTVVQLNMQTIPIQVFVVRALLVV